MDMVIAHKRFNRVDLLTVKGRMDAASAPQLKQAIDGLFDENRYRIVLDLAELTALDIDLDSGTAWA